MNKNLEEYRYEDLHFNKYIAIEAGIDEAIMLNNFYYWLTKNRANGKNIRDGKVWTYNKLEAFEEMFPFWSIKQIRRILKSLIDNEYLETGNYNKMKNDRTLWYTLTKKGWKLLNPAISDICPNGQNDLPKQTNDICPNGQMSYAQTGTPLPNNKPYNKTNNKKEKGKSEFDEVIEGYTDNNDLQETLIEYIKMRHSIKKPMTTRALKILINKLDKLTSDTEEKIKMLENSIVGCWLTVYELKEKETKILNPHSCEDLIEC